jgi:hypothetical protein
MLLIYFGQEPNEITFFYMLQNQGEEEIGHYGIFAETTRNENFKWI